MARSEARRRSRSTSCRKCARRLVVRLLPPMLPTLLMTTPVWAAQWYLVPTLSVAEFYSDNINLAPAALATSAWVTQVRPALNLNVNGANLKFTATYGAELLYNSQTEDLTARHQLSGSTNGSMEIVPQLVYIDTSTKVAQQNASALQPLATNNINTTTNRATVKTNTVSPYLRYNFGTEVLSEARFTYSTVNAGGSTSLSSSDANRFDLRFSSGPGYKLTTWQVAYSRETIEYSNGLENRLESIIAGVKRLITYNIGLVANAGYEKNEYPTTGQQPKGQYWNVGFNWTPTPRTNLTATTGRRYFGSTKALDFSHRMRLMIFNVSYDEEVTSTRSQFFVPTKADTATYLDNLFLSSIPDPVARQLAVQQYITQNGLPATLLVPVNFFSNQTFLVKSWRAAVGLQGVRHTVMTNYFMQNRTTESPTVTGAGDFAASSSVKQTGASVLWNWRLTGYTASNASAGYSRNEFAGIARSDNSKYVRLGVTHQFSPYVSGAVSIQRLNNESNQAGASYKENQISAQAQMRF